MLNSFAMDFHKQTTYFAWDEAPVKFLYDLYIFSDKIISIPVLRKETFCKNSK